MRRLDRLRAQFDRAPRDMERALPLANAYLDYGRSTGDARYLGRALAVIEPWLQATPAPLPILLIHATILQSRHAFTASRIELREVLRREPRDAQAWLTLAAVAMVQADYVAANDACVHLAEASGDLLGILCTAQLRSLEGRASQAYALLALIEHPGGKVPAEVRSYVEGVMADTAARLGRNAEADRHFKAALQWTPGDNFLLADYADFLLDRHRAREAIALLADYGQSDTSFVRTVFAEATLRDPRAPRDIAAMRARFAAMDRRGSRLYQREHAMFVLRIEHDARRALELSQENWTVQRAPEDMRIYLESALAADEPQAAEPVLRLIAHSRLQDPAIGRLTREITAATPRRAEPGRGGAQMAMREGTPR